jgi:hypothetical protein
MYIVVLVLATLVFIAVAFWFVRSEYFSPFHPFTIYLAFHGFLFVFRPIVAVIEDFHFLYNAYDFQPSSSDKITAILVSILGLLSFAFFCFRKGNVAMRFSADQVSIRERQALLRPFLLAALICFPIGFYSLITSWNHASNGTLAAAQVMDKATRIQINVSQNGYATDAQLMLASCGAILAWLFRFRLLAILPLATFVVLRAGTGGRGPFVAGAAALCLLWLYERRIKWPPPRVLFGLALLVLAFNFVGADRGGAIRQWFGAGSSVQKDANDQKNRFLEGMDFANLEYLEYVVYTIPERTHTYSYFTEELQLFTEPVPRALWTNKPIGPPILLFNLFDYGNPIGMTVTLAGMGWAGAGWLGVVFWCGSWGYALGLIYRKYVCGPQSAFQTAAYMVFLSSLVVAFRDGGLVTLARQNMFFLAPVLLWLLVARWLGIPSVAEVRRRLAMRARSRDQNATQILAEAEAEAEETTRPGLRKIMKTTPWLPPAVLRRRAALAAGQKAQER